MAVRLLRPHRARRSALSRPRGLRKRGPHAGAGGCGLRVLGRLLVFPPGRRLRSPVGGQWGVA
eukprot:7726204-Alexandrium_andersonii.AAC.1